MRLTHYTRGFVPEFDCVIHGTIFCTLAEWEQVLRYLNTRRELIERHTSWDSLVQRTVTGFRDSRHSYHCLGVTPTQLIATQFGLSNYLPGNYQFAIEKKGNR